MHLVGWFIWNFMLMCSKISCSHGWLLFINFFYVLIYWLAGGNSAGGSLLADDGQRRNPSSSSDSLRSCWDTSSVAYQSESCHWMVSWMLLNSMDADFHETYFPEVPTLNMNPVTNYSEWGFSLLSSVAQANTKVIPQLDHDWFLPCTSMLFDYRITDAV